MQNQVITNVDKEAQALAACYRLLLQKARERRERLAKAANSLPDENLPETDEAPTEKQ